MEKVYDEMTDSEYADFERNAKYLAACYCCRSNHFWSDLSFTDNVGVENS